MRVLIQRVRQASVTVDGVMTGSIGQGLLLLVGVTHTDTFKEMQWLCDKILNLRIFADEEGKMNRSVIDVQGGLLVVSQFTLYGDARRGTRPGYTDAAPPEIARPIYEAMIHSFRDRSVLQVESGVFGAMMDVALVNDGPVTIWLERETPATA